MFMLYSLYSIPDLSSSIIDMKEKKEKKEKNKKQKVPNPAKRTAPLPHCGLDPGVGPCGILIGWAADCIFRPTIHTTS